MWRILQQNSGRRFNEVLRDGILESIIITSNLDDSFTDEDDDEDDIINPALVAPVLLLRR